jgi:DNA polymerase-3 subunit epsilon
MTATRVERQFPGAVQGMFGDLGTPLFDATFVVVDLETTGGSPADAGITEIGAVKVRGGTVLGEFQTLVNPGTPIPPLIAALTGITDSAVAGAPGVASATAAFLEFSAGCVLVAHNAPYDTGFLRGACARHGLHWPAPAVVDTARVARAALLRDEVPNHKLATLARLARSATSPNHRALTDARATVDVLHFLIGRLGDLGVTTVEELAALTVRVSAHQRRKRHLADPLPNTPGVYQFLDVAGRPLYIGTSRTIRDRVRTYFTATEKRTRMAEMVGLATSVTAIECATALEAAVRETRLLAAHKPPYNRKSRFPEHQAWVKMTLEPFPRLSVVGKPPPQGTDCLGPFPNRRWAAAVVEALQLAFPLRSCTTRLPLVARGNACLAADLGHCIAPCDGTATGEDYAQVVDEALGSWRNHLGPVAERLLARAAQHAVAADFERAALWRDAAATLADAVAGTHRRAMLAQCAELVAARPTTANGWEIHVIRHGRLAAAGVAQPGTDPKPLVARLQACAEVVQRPESAGPAACLTEVGHIERWLFEPSVRIVVADPPLAMPMTAAHRVSRRLREARRPESVVDLRGSSGGPPVAALRPVHRLVLAAEAATQTSAVATSRHAASVPAAEPSAIAARERA